MAGKEKLESYSPKMVHAGDFPVVTDSGTVASGETIHELMPITLGADGKIKAVTADTVADVYGLAAENAEEGIDFHSKMLEYIKTGDVPKLKKLNNELFDQIELEVRENMVHDEA